MGAVMKGIMLWLMYFNFPKKIKEDHFCTFNNKMIKFPEMSHSPSLGANISVIITWEKNLHLSKASLVGNYIIFK